MHFTLLYVVALIIYLTSCLNAHNRNTCVRYPQTGCIAQVVALFIISQDHQTGKREYLPLLPWQPPL